MPNDSEASPRSPGATRSSANWQEMPGGADRLNTRMLFASTNPFGIPDLPKAERQPSRLTAYSDRRACDTARPGDAVHFFLDDYRFEVAWSKPERALSRVQRVSLALTPDFSLWREMPPVMQQWQVYRSRWCGAWWTAHGVDVIPTVSWSDEASHAFAFAGISQGSVVAVSSVGVLGDQEARRLFTAGLAQLRDAIMPPLVLCYGRIPLSMRPDDLDVREYPAGRF